MTDANSRSIVKRSKAVPPPTVGPMRPFATVGCLRWVLPSMAGAAKPGAGRPVRTTEAVGPAGRLPCDARSPGPPLNSLRSLRSLRSNSRGESDVEARCARGQASCASRRPPRAPRPARSRLRDNARGVRPANATAVDCQGRRAPSPVSKGGGAGAARSGGESPDTNSPVDCLCLANARGTVPWHGGRGCPAALARWTAACLGQGQPTVRFGPQAASTRLKNERATVAPGDSNSAAQAMISGMRRWGLQRACQEARHVG
jgi:hypothetical protein